MRVDSDFKTDVVVITPTIGSPTLYDAIESVQNQNLSNVTHMLVIDGENHSKKVVDIVSKFDQKNIKIITLPFNTSKGIEGLRFNGHRIYAACPYFINSEFIFFLDEDNWYDPNHVSSLINIILTENLDWAYSLRKIYTEDKQFVINDDCESLGPWPTYSGFPPLVDTSCYAFKRDTLTRVNHLWYHPLGADRSFYHSISFNFKRFRCSAKYSLNYRLHDNRPPHPDFFIAGSEKALAFYKGNPPWNQPTKYELWS